MVRVTVAAVVLAAGAGSRFGGPKALVELDGERLVDRMVRALSEGGITRTYVVQGAADLAGLSGAELVDNPHWVDGMGSSLQAGMGALPTDVDVVVVVPVDQPGLTAAAVRRVLAAAADDPQQALVVATFSGRRGHPVLLGRRHWAGAASSAVGDVGARAYLTTRSDVVEVECADVASGLDVDEPADLQRFRTTSA